MIFGLLLLALLSGGVSRAEEARREIDPAHVGRLLLSPNEGERHEGRALLLERIGQGGDLDGFLRRMADTQAQIAGDVERLIRSLLEDALSDDLTRQKDARRVLRALGPDALARLRTELRRQSEEATARQGTPQQAAAPAPAAAPQAARPAPPRVEVRDATKPTNETAKSVMRATPVLITVLTADRGAFLKRMQDTALPGSQGKGSGFERGEPLVLDGKRAESVLGLTMRIPESRRLAEGWQEIGDRPFRVVEPEQVRYRRGIRQTKKGAWALDSGSLPRGLSVEMRLGEGRLWIVAQDASVPEPMPVTRVRPNQEVDPVEIDQPEWRVVSTEASIPWAPGRSGLVAVLLPAVVENKILVIGLSSRLPKQKAASSPQR